MRYFLFCFLALNFFVQAQEPTSALFANEVEDIQKKYDSLWDASKETIVFTGSSSIRVWHDLQQRFPNYQIVNSGFGGSQASDLLQYTDELILRYTPEKVFIYEGDNDISAGKKSKEIVVDILAIISKIKRQNPTADIILISAKPSIARWNLKKSYKRLNRKFKRLSKKDAELHYVDVWKPMLQKRKLKQDLFVADGLHMNTKGYAIWYETIKPFLD